MTDEIACKMLHEGTSHQVGHPKGGSPMTGSASIMLAVFIVGLTLSLSVAAKLYK